MRNRMLLAGLLVMSLAGCTTGAAAPSSSANSPAPSTAVASPAIAAPSPKTEPLDVAVKWDGSKCTYLGPTVILDGTLTRFSFTSSEPLMLVIVGVEPGKTPTWDEIVALTKTHAATDVPDWVILTGYANIPANSSALFPVSSKVGVGQTPVGGYFVGCATAPKPQGTDVMYPAVLLQIAGA